VVYGDHRRKPHDATDAASLGRSAGGTPGVGVAIVGTGGGSWRLGIFKK
jgi:hypothetical protein